MSDLRYALRVLIRTPGLTAVAILSLALGIGANVTIYTIANAFLDQPIAGAHDVDRLVRIYRGDHSPLQYADLERVRAEKGVFSDVAGERMTAVAVTIGSDIQRVQASLVTDGYFRMLAVQPEIGRLFAQSDSIDTAPVIVISHAFWRDHLGADSAVIGHTLNVNDRLFTIIGVAPAEFSSSMFLWRADLWLPPSAAALLIGVPFAKWGGSLYTTARLAPGATMPGAQASVATVAARLRTEDPEGHQGFRFRVDGARGIHAELRGPTVVASGFLMVVVGMVLLIACANVANLLLARATSRRREISIRTALGAGRARLVRQLLLESLVIALAGGVIGLLSASWVAELIRNFAIARSPEPISLEVSPDGRVLAFALGVSVVSALLFGLLPALRATASDILPALRDEAPQSTSRSRARSVLIAVQMTLCTVLLACSMLFLHSLINARVIDPGFDSRGVLDASVDISSRNLSPERGRAFYEELRTRASRLPGVGSATLAAIVPLGGSNMQVGTWLEGGDASAQRPAVLPGFNVVAPSYFETLGIPVLSGRAITVDDRAETPATVVVNEQMARHLWPNQSPIGRRISLEGPTGPWLTIVGVVKNTKYNSLGESPRDFMYLPFAQHFRNEMILQVRANSASLTPKTLRDLVRDLDARLPPVSASSLADDMRIVLLPAELSAALLGTFGILALLLGSVGIYGVTSYSVAQRTREMGIRAALGATARDLVQLVASQSMRVVVIGGAIGLVLAFGAARLLTSQLYGVSAVDPLTFVAMPVVLFGVALVATLIPARRATRADPAEALRSE
jgi:predicted permease